jgi:hypothetical protein
MAHSQIEGRAPLVAASAMGANLPITFSLGGSVGASALSETVRLAPSFNMLQFGITAATVITAGDPVTYWGPHDVGKGIAGAAIKAGAMVGVGSSNGVLQEVIANGSSGPVAAYRIGVALKTAAAGDVFPVYIMPGQVV